MPTQRRTTSSRSTPFRSHGSRRRASPSTPVAGLPWSGFISRCRGRPCRACQRVLWGGPRLIGTRDSRSDTVAEALAVQGEPWDFDLLADKILPLQRPGLVSLRIERARRVAVGAAPDRAAEAAAALHLRRAVTATTLPVAWRAPVPSIEATARTQGAARARHPYAPGLDSGSGCARPRQARTACAPAPMVHPRAVRAPATGRSRTSLGRSVKLTRRRPRSARARRAT